MNEQNIQNIISYFTQNPGMAPEQLIQNLRTTGYPQTDIDAAMNRIGISPQQTPNEAAPVETIEGDRPARNLFSKKIIMGSIGGILLLVLLIYGGKYILSRFQGQVATITPTPIPSPLPTAPVATIVGDPTTTMKQTLSSGVYKITIDQVIIDPTSTEESTLTYYIDAGDIVRFDHSGGAIFIVQNETIYTIDANTKTYGTYAANAAQKSVMLSALNETNVIRSFIENTENGTYEWQKLSENEWQGNNRDTQHRFTARLDELTGLLQFVEEYDEQDTKVSSSRITVEPTTITAETLEVPPDLIRVEETLQ